MKVEFKEMTQQEAEEIAFNWHYEGQYAFYDMAADEEDLAGFLDPGERKGAVFAAQADGRLIGFFSVSKVNAETIEIGLGLRPDLTGKGVGKAFVQAGLAFAKRHFTFLGVTLAVASFNERAIRLYEKCGFKKTGTFCQETNGGEYEFVKMELRLLRSEPEGAVRELADEVKKLTGRNFTGFYIHGSLAMGGFNPANSDIDILMVTEIPVKELEKQYLRKLFLAQSGRPFPLEISLMNRRQLADWHHPSPFDFHYSEDWRDRPELPDTDTDLAAHLTVLKERGFCADGKPIAEVIPDIPWEDYLDAILGDFEDCRVSPLKNPMYRILNAVRVLQAVKTQEVASKSETADWGLANLSEEWHGMIRITAEMYAGNGLTAVFNEKELSGFFLYIDGEIKKEMRNRHAEENDGPGLL